MRVRTDSVYIIGIAGGSGSGKSTFSERLRALFPDAIALVSCDNYYRANDHLPLEERRLLNYDAPEALEFDLMVSHLAALRRGEAVECPVYDFGLHTRSAQTATILPRPVIIVDGILILSDPALRESFDLKIYVETDADERILRRAKRDMETRNRRIEDITHQYLTTVKPMHEAYVEPSKRHADLILNGGLNDVALGVVEARVRAFLRSDE